MQPGSLPPSLADVASCINADRIDEADRLLAAIEADRSHIAWSKPITIGVLRDRITLKRSAP